MDAKMMSAGEALTAAAAAVLKTVPGIGAVYQGAPRRAAFPNAVVDGIESDWGHKSGAGREVRLAATLRDGAEQAGRLRSLASGAEAALAGIGRDLDGWSLVTFQFVRRRTVPDGQGWAAIIEFRARMLQR